MRDVIAITRGVVLGFVLATSIAAPAAAKSFPAQSLTVGGVNSQNGAIPDGTSSACDTPGFGLALEANFNVDVQTTASAISVAFTASHTWIGDLHIELVAPTGQTVTLADRVGRDSPSSCGSSADINGPFVFSDSAATTWWASTTSGTYHPVAASGAFVYLAGLDGVATVGTWKVRFRDAQQGDSGTVASATLNIDGIPDLDPPVPVSTDPASPSPTAAVKVIGTVGSGVDAVAVYLGGTCAGTSSGFASASTFTSTGVSITVPTNTTTTLSARGRDTATNNLTACSSQTLSYTHDSVAPAIPAVGAVGPASPANDNAPAVSGTSDPGSTVRLYTTDDCSGAPAQTGTAAAFALPGLTIPVADDSTTTFRARAVDLAGNVSGCSTTSATYVEDSTSQPPVLGGVTPTSPADNNAPTVFGTAEADSTVRLFANGDCSATPAVTGTAAAFASPGFTVSVADDSTTTFTARAVDPLGNVSACSASLSYVEDTPDPPPVTPATTTGSVPPPPTTVTPGGSAPPPPTTAVALPSTAAAVAQAFGLPAAGRCLSRRRLEIRIKEPTGLAVRSATVQVGSRKAVKALRKRGRLTATVDLRKLTGKTIVVRIHLTLADGRIAKGRRTYRPCGAKRRT